MTTHPDDYLSEAEKKFLKSLVDKEGNPSRNSRDILKDLSNETMVIKKVTDNNEKTDEVSAINYPITEFTPLHLIIRIDGRACPYLIKYIIQELNADMNVKDYQDNTALQLACFNSYDAAAMTLIELGADIQNLENWNYSALTLATFHSNFKIMDILLRNGSIVNQKLKEYGEYPEDSTNLHIAVRKRHYCGIIQLMKYGADPFAKDADGKIPLDYLETSYLTTNEPIDDDFRMDDLRDALEFMRRRNQNGFDMTKYLGTFFVKTDYPDLVTDIKEVKCYPYLQDLLTGKARYYSDFLMDFFDSSHSGYVFQFTGLSSKENQKLVLKLAKICVQIRESTENCNTLFLECINLISQMNFKNLKSFRTFDEDMLRKQIATFEERSQRTCASIYDPEDTLPCFQILEQCRVVRRVLRQKNYDAKGWAYNIENAIDHIKNTWNSISMELIEKCKTKIK
eukprot:NODE_18_length_47517_cov_0.674814.p10 type:complete len:454 gc:universal NODE_18_length_47517_cov_0.674814:32446-33807(+)